MGAMVDDRARTLRKNSTGPERKLWAALGRFRNNGFHFRRQVRFGKYIADFVSHRERLVVEVDGAQHYLEAHRARDESRTKYLEACGYRVLRFSNYEVLQGLYGVECCILDALNERKGVKFEAGSSAVPPPEPSRPDGLKRSTAPQRGR
jgi:very-short-patch-repair endonuclease